MPWPVVPRRALDSVVDLLARDTGGGVALLGSEGVGKTTLAAQAAERLGREPVWVIGTLTQSAVPFGAFGQLIDFHDAGKPAALIHSAADAVLARADSAPIIIDNARLLDPLSAALVYRLAQDAASRPGSRLIVTVRSILRAPQVVTALWNDGLLHRFDVEPFDSDETAAVVAAAGGGDAAALYRRSAGNALHLRLLMSGGGSEETLAAAVDAYLKGLARPVQDVLGYLCVYEPLDHTDLIALTGASAVEAAREAGAIAVRDPIAHAADGADVHPVYSGHPLFLEQLARALDKPTTTRLRAAVAARLSSQPSRNAADRLGRTVLAVYGGVPIDGDSVVTAAQEALRLGDLSLAERLARGALDRGEPVGAELPARLALGNALAWQGRGREADAVLSAVDPATITDDELIAWAVPRAANQFWMLSEPERATAFLQTVRNRVTTPAARTTLDALSATFAMNAGNLRRALAVAEEVLGRSDAKDNAVAWAASAAALCSARMGRLDKVPPLVNRALSSEYPGLMRFTVGLAETTTLLMNAQSAAALDAARGFTDFAELAQPGRAIGDVLLAQVLLARGESETAVQLLAPASATLERTGYSWGPLALTLLATALAYRGEVAESAKALSRALARHGTKSAMFTPELGIARAWRLAVIGDRHAAITAARDAARMAERTGQSAVAVRAWHEAVRLGDRRAADAMPAAAATAPCAFTDLALTHARALAGDDAAGLTDVADRLTEAGLLGAAADAAAQAGAVRA
ncbi:MAG: ATP-binding protein [Mycobacterium sp.]|nr:ATP-binding protein [Mycobacterium sp.]